MRHPLDHLPSSGLIIITGATGAGKSALALDFAEERGLDVISADSRQIYKGMEIGTDAPSQRDQGRARHRFIGCLEPWVEYSAFDYARDALPIIEGELASKGSALVVGGSYLYLRALLYDMDDIPSVPASIRERLTVLYGEEGLAPIVEKLQRVDPEYLQKVDRGNYRRLIRALEVYEATGKPFSSFHTARQRLFPFPVTVVQVERDRKELYDRINRRVDKMVEEGLVEEVRRLLPYKEKNALRTIGYKEIFDYLYGEKELQECIELIKKNTRIFARHQITTLKHLPNVITIRL